MMTVLMKIIGQALKEKSHYSQYNPEPSLIPAFRSFEKSRNVYLFKIHMLTGMMMNQRSAGLHLRYIQRKGQSEKYVIHISYFHIDKPYRVNNQPEKRSCIAS